MRPSPPLNGELRATGSWLGMQPPVMEGKKWLGGVPRASGGNVCAGGDDQTAGAGWVKVNRCTGRGHVVHQALLATSNTYLRCTFMVGGRSQRVVRERITRPSRRHRQRVPRQGGLPGVNCHFV